MALTNVGYAQSGTHDLAIVTAAGGITQGSNVTTDTTTTKSRFAPQVGLGGSAAVAAAAAGTATTGFLFTPQNTAIATYSIAYPDPQDVTLRYTINYAPAALTGAQARFGQMLNGVQATPTAATASFAATLYGISSVSTLGAVYDSLSGEGVTAVQTAALSSMAMAHDLLDEQRSTSVGAYAAPYDPDHRSSLWVSVRGSQSRLSGVDGTHGVDTSGFVVEGGYNLRLSPRLVLGLAVGGDPQSFTVDDINTAGKLHVLSGGAYLGFAAGGWKLSADLLYSNLKTAYTRSTFIPGQTETTHGDFTAQALSSRLEVARQFDVGGFGLQSIAGVTLTHLTLPSFAETSIKSDGTAGSLNLLFGDHKLDDAKSYLGGEIDRAVPVGGNSIFRMSVRGRWEHDFDPSRIAPVSLAAAPTISFNTTGAPGATDAATFDLRGTLRVKGLDITAGVGHTAAARYRSTSADIGLRFNW